MLHAANHCPSLTAMQQLPSHKPPRATHAAGRLNLNAVDRRRVIVLQFDTVKEEIADASRSLELKIGPRSY